jgi:HAD superfamily hydrolase (TIGR01490 family)
MPCLYFFDVDHTLIRGSTGSRFAVAAARRGVIRFHHLAMIPLNYAVYRHGKGSTSFFEGEFPAIKGVEKSLLEEIARDVFDRQTRKALRPELLKLVASIKAEGGTVVLATSSLDIIVRPLAELIGADAVLASSLEYKAGLCTGRLAGQALFGTAKRDAVLAFARNRGTALADCAFYSDSIHDLPLLLEVGHPVAVAPDRRLRRVAYARGWLILDD